MSSGYDDRFDDEPEDDRRDDRRERSPQDTIARARARVSTPAMMLIVSGLIGLLLEAVWVVVMVTNPTMLYDVFVDMIKNQPQTPEQQKQLKDMEAKKDDMRLDTPLNVASVAVGFIFNVLTVIGGMKMRSLSGYGLSLTGAIVGIIPMGGCCCLTFPFGIWSLIVLLNDDVKAGYKAVSRSASGMDGEY